MVSYAVVLLLWGTRIEAISAIEATTAMKPANVIKYIQTRPARPPLVRPNVLAVNCVSHVDIRMQAVSDISIPPARQRKGWLTEAKD